LAFKKDSRLFLQFLSLILICWIRNAIQTDMVLRNLTIREVMEDMEALAKLTYSGRYGQLYTETSCFHNTITIGTKMNKKDYFHFNIISARE
jgi:hypothetical protein